MRVLVSRPDRLGDLILSTPVLEAIRVQAPSAKVWLLAQKSHFPILRGHPFIEGLIAVEPLDRLAQQLKEYQFSHAICLQSNRSIAWTIWRAGVPLRVGPLSKPHSWILYNRGVRQRRSRVERHETEYNLELLRGLGLGARARMYFPRVMIPDEARLQAQAWLGASDRPRVALHPGMGGSAENWSLQNYQALARELKEKNIEVIVTAGAHERDLARAFSGIARTWEGDLATLGALYRECAVVVAPSTGPLHLAAAVGTPVVGLYPDEKVRSPARWGPYVSDPRKATVLVARAGNMQTIEVSSVTDAVWSYLKGSR